MGYGQASGNRAESLNLDVGWRIGERSFDHICDLISRHNLCNMLEFGSGASTVRFALEFDDLKVTSIDHDRAFLDETRMWASKCGVSDRVHLIHAPLHRIWIGGRNFESYRFRFSPDSSFGLALVDGPPHYARWGREACLYSAYGYLNVGSFVILDDAEREDERQTVRNWLLTYPDSLEKTQVVSASHGLAICKKTRDGMRHWSFRTVVSHYRAEYKHLLFTAKASIKRGLSRYSS